MPSGLVVIGNNDVRSTHNFGKKGVAHSVRGKMSQIPGGRKMLTIFLTSWVGKMGVF